MDPISFNETFVKDIFDEIDGINGKRKGVVHDREFTTVTNDDKVYAEFDDDDVASLSNENEDYRYQDMGETSDGSKYWFPSVDVKYKPKVGDSFESVESAEKMYRKYANEVGFDVRGRTIRNSNIKRSGCGACLKIHLVKEPNQYEVYKFVEQHNHILFNKEEMRFSRSKRQLHYADHKNVFHGSSSKVGVTKSHRFIKAVKGGVDSSGGTVRDHQNFKRDMTYFVGNKDAQMLLNVMANRRKVCLEFFFEYKCDDKELAIFWADETARSNYREFGDAISFDATFRTNKHAMIFVPFVAIDNHKKSVVVGAALIYNESVVDYTWISNYLQHRTQFVSKFNKLTWNVHLGPNEFEMQWNNLIDFYGLRGDPWFDELYNIRESWIPAYYKDYHMSGLMKTTSRSESINAIFNVYAHFWHDLVVFLRSFDNAVESQRATHGSLEVTTKSTIPRLVSPCKLEAHAAEVYTRTIFFEIQKELRKAVWLCGWDGFTDIGETRVYIITHKNKASKVTTKYTVIKNKMENSYDCSCNCFVRNGISCRHALKVMLNDEVDKIPDKYILRRWRRDLVPVEWLPAHFRYGESHTEETTSSIKEFLGVSQPETVDVLPPTGIRNKGCGTGKRLISAAEKAIPNGKKQNKKCRLCGQMATHDSRNCPKRDYI
ncbi:protein FAR1-RELATED SEQUENCE 5-like [Cynara cardunculus var. scolymus]|uniref:protein FAR1-RELATED SEQUENCE 5-like n=1 Tax=Cynara cardunculus var. scolymus TaxID=59895 RepID=UPI000D628967|nr:protein FAR1-RELATED SEQUENCE 5-like [Cynara cardunculus var. scolymus]